LIKLCNATQAERCIREWDAEVQARETAEAARDGSAVKSEWVEGEGEGSDEGGGGGGGGEKKSASRKRNDKGASAAAK
jgi:hypothetical protein